MVDGRTERAYLVTTEPQRPHLAPKVSVSFATTMSDVPNTSGFLIIREISMILCKV